MERPSKYVGTLSPLLHVRIFKLPYTDTAQRLPRRLNDIESITTSTCTDLRATQQGHSKETAKTPQLSGILHNLYKGFTCVARITYTRLRKGGDPSGTADYLSVVGA